MGDPAGSGWATLGGSVSPTPVAQYRVTADRDFKNGGREWRPRGVPHPVRVHDFIDPEKGKAIPYGVYDLAQ